MSRPGPDAPAASDRELAAKVAAWPAFIERYPLLTHVLAQLDPIIDRQTPVMAVSRRGGRFQLHVNPDFVRNEPRYVTGVLLHEVQHVTLGHVTHPRFRRARHPDLMNLAMEMSANENIQDPLPGMPVVWPLFARYGVRAGQSTFERYQLLRKAREHGERIAVLGRLVDEHRPDGVGRLTRVRPGADFDELESGGAADAPGLGAGELLEELGQPVRAPQSFSWRTALRDFVARERRPTACWSRPNRRFADQIGERPGRIRRIDEHGPPSLIAAIDTSGSMDADTLVEIGDALAALRRLSREITVVECDARIQRVYRFDGALRDVQGRGGTDLRPVFEPAFLRAHPSDLLVYFTDGEGAVPEKDPGVPTLWVLSGNGNVACRWGKRAWL